MIKVNLECKNPDFIPVKGTSKSAGYDLKTANEFTLEIKPRVTEVIPTGIKLEIVKDDYEKHNIEFQIRPRSKVSHMGLLVHQGTIDSDYRGELSIIVTNLNEETVKIDPNTRIAQLICAHYYEIDFNTVDHIDPNSTERGANGFGSTGNALNNKGE